MPLAPIRRPVNPFIAGNLLAGAPQMMAPPVIGPLMSPELMGAPQLGQFRPAQPAQMPAAMPPPMPAGMPASAGNGGGGLAALGGLGGLGGDPGLAFAAGILGGGTTAQALGQGFQNVLAMRAKQAPPTTDDLKEYAVAKQQGYGGSFMDYLTAVKKAGASNVDVRNMGTIPPGYKVDYDEAGNPVSMSPIPGGPAAEKEAATREAAANQEANKQEQAATMVTAVAGIKDAFKDTDPNMVAGTLSRPFALYTGSAAGKVRSYVKVLQSNVALDAMLKLKQASATGATGFGQLSERELEVLINNIGALNPDTTDPQIFMQTIDKIDRSFRHILEVVPADKLKALGIYELLASGSGASLPDGWTVEEVP